MKLAAILERMRMIDVEQQLPLHRPICDDPRRHALAEALPHPISAVGQPLKTNRPLSDPSQAQEWIEAVQHVAQRTIELDPRRREGATFDRQVDQGGIGHVVDDVSGNRA